MTALPSADHAKDLLPKEDETAFSLYRSVVLPAESAASEANNKVDVMYSRVIGYLLLYAPSDTARGALKLEITSCHAESDPNPAIYKLGEHYVKNLLRIFRNSRRRTPYTSDHSSPSTEGEHRVDLQPTPRDHSKAKAEVCFRPKLYANYGAFRVIVHRFDQALARDKYRCMLTGKVDMNSLSGGLVTLRQSDELSATHCCHIIPDSLGNIEAGGAGKKEHQAATFWTILQRFGYRSVYEELEADTKGNNIHRLENILTLDLIIHYCFDNQRLWLEAIGGQEHCYRIVVLSPGTPAALHLPERVQFVTNTDYPLPSPSYLHIHAVCCRIAHMSGAAEYLDMIFRDMEELKVLSKDGESADVLAYALHGLVEPVSV